MVFANTCRHADSAASYPASHTPQPATFVRILREHLPGFKVYRRDKKQVLPTSVVQQLERASECGDPAYGYATIGCSSCGLTRDVALSCKSRICPRCLTSRMWERAAQLVDNVFDGTPVRHWVGSLPPHLKYNLGYDRKLVTGALDAYVQAFSHYQRSKAIQLLGLPSDALVQTGAASMQHRGSITLVTNVHFHFIVPDGVYVQRTPGGPVEFVPLPPPTRDELAEIAAHACRLTCEVLARRGFWTPSTDETPAGRVRGFLTYGAPRWATFFGAAADTAEFETDGSGDDSRAYPFTVFAGNRIVDRVHLENLALYIMSPPFTDGQVSIDADGMIRFRPKRLGRDGAKEIRLAPFAFLDRVVSLIAPPRSNLNRYHGVFAPNARLRKHVVPQGTNRALALQDAPADQPRSQDEKRVLRRVRSQEADLRSCPRCGTQLELVALVTHKFKYKNPRWLSPDTPVTPADEPASQETIAGHTVN